MSEIDVNMELRGKCKEMSEALVEASKGRLRLVRGHYHCHVWGEQAHWWTVDEEGNINDPTKDQFPSKGTGVYVEFDGMCTCAECGKEVPEKEADIGGNGHYAFCSGRCHARFVGVEEFYRGN